MTLKFEYHTFLHHSQTVRSADARLPTFEYHTFLHHSQTVEGYYYSEAMFEYHTFLHHSQTGIAPDFSGKSLSTIHFYIILKPQI